MSLANLTTEGRNPNSAELDRLAAVDIVRLMNAEDARVPQAVALVANEIGAAIEMITERLRSGGRLIYMGAGTSGRLGVLDAAECPPTFTSPPWQVVGLIAGGETALTRAVEGAEDHPELGVADLEHVDCCAKDVVVGIATSGRTPYVIGGLQHARSVGAATIGLSCNPDSGLKAHCDLEIAPVVGPEVVTGSTRLKAGTATKLVLNMLTTGTMVRLGKTYGNLMVDLQATNEKLADRSERIVAELANVPRPRAAELLVECDGDVKTAIVAQLRQESAEAARAQLRAAGGRLREALDSDFVAATGETSGHVPLVLGIDGGGTSTRVWLAPATADTTDPIGVGEAGSANPHAVGWTAGMANLDLAIGRAFEAAGITRHPVAAACLAIAGTGAEEEQQRLQKWAKTHRIAEHVITTHDAEPVLAEGTTAGVGIVLISGTGSFAWGRNQAGDTSRAGGWGHRMGDPGSGYAIGLAGLRAVIGHHDGMGPSTRLTRAVTGALGLSGATDIRKLVARDTADVTTIAGLAPIVQTEAENGDEVARLIVDEAARELAHLVATIARQLFGTADECQLALAGGMLTHSALLREPLIEQLHAAKIALTSTQIVTEPVRGTIRMARAALASHP